MNALVQVPTNGLEFRQSTDAAGLCGAIVKQTAKKIQGRGYVTVEGWQAIAIAHGCTASALEVERVPDEGMSGFKCIAVVRRMDDGREIARAEGFLGDDEKVWANRAVYARRAMVQTRAISRACRSAFAHVVVMIDAGLSTTPAEEVPDGGFVDAQYTEVREPERQQNRQQQQTRRQSRNDDGMPSDAWAKLVQLIEATNADTGKMLKHFGVPDLKRLSPQQYDEAVAKLENDLAARAKADTNRAGQATSNNTRGEFDDVDAADVQL